MSRVSAMGTMAATLAHELNQPLAAVESYIGAARNLMHRHRLGGATDLDTALAGASRSEEHTSELQSLMRNSYAVFCFKKKKKTKTRARRITSQQRDTQPTNMNS